MLTDDTHKINRKVIMLQKGFTQRSLAVAVNRTPAAVNFLLAGKTKRREMQELVAQVLGVTPQKFWPEFYPDVNESSHDAKINEVREILHEQSGTPVD